MSKPYGMTAALQIIRPDAVQDAVWDAVERAVDAGWTVEQFRSEAADCWNEYLRQKRESDMKAWSK